MSRRWALEVVWEISAWGQRWRLVTCRSQPSKCGVCLSRPGVGSILVVGVGATTAVEGVDVVACARNADVNWGV